MNITSIVEKYASAFKLYAWYYHNIRHRRSNRSPGNGTGNQMQIVESIDEWVQSLEEKGCRIYGKDILMGYGKAKTDITLFVSHELSLSGAPVALFHFAVMMCKKNRKSIIISPEDGHLGPYALKHNVPVIVIPELFNTDYILGVRKMFSQIVVSTLVGFPVIKLLNGTDSSVIWWIHECAQIYSRNMAEQMPWIVDDNIHIFCGGAYARKMLKKRFPRYKTKLLLYCTDDLTKRESDKKEKIRQDRAIPTYACVALIEKRKGQDILIRAIDMLPEEVRKNCCFIFVGKSADVEMRKIIAEKAAKNQEQIIFYEGLGIEELYDLYEEIDYLICPSRDDPMPVVVAEALSLGKPCICSKNTGSAAVIKGFHAGFCYGHDDPRRLAELIVKTNRVSDDCYDKLSINARTAYETAFSEKVFEENVMKICL